MSALLSQTVERTRPYIELVQDAARRIGEAFEAAVNGGEIDRDALFTFTYHPIPDTSPPQFMAPFTALTDRLLPDIQDGALERLPGIAFCSATDRNGYIPTHNRQYSKPQRPGDTAWNAANSRNRRIFDDHSGITAARNSRPFLIQAYDRDLGGRVALINEIDAPITVFDQHWGAFRLGYTL